MSNIDMQAFPEISSLLWRRDQEVNSIRNGQKVDATSEQIALFWQQVSQRINNEEELGNALSMMGELNADMDLLRGMRDRLAGRRDPESQVQLQLITRILQFLTEAGAGISRRLALLRDRAFQYYWLYNPALHNKTDQKVQKDKEKQKDKDGKTTDDQVRKVLDETKKQATPAKAERPPEKRDKKMSP